MTFRLLVEEVRKAVSAAVASAGFTPVEFDVSEPPRKEFGDLTCNVAFQLGKQLKKAPPRVAAELIGHIKAQIEQGGSGGSLVHSVEPHPAGYINFRADYARLSPATLGRVLSAPEAYGNHDLGGGRHVVIEHTSVNPNKALHVGHMRNVVLGDTLRRIMGAANYRATVLNYIDDSGLQVADIVVGFRFAGFQVEPHSKDQKFDQYCGDEVYIKINELYERDPALAEKRKLVLKEIEEGRSEIARFAAEITLRVLGEQLKTCWRMKARYDLLNFESQIVHSMLWSRTFELLKKEGIARLEEEGKNKGCWVIDAEGEEENKVIVRSDGTATYMAKDIPYAAWKLGLVDDPFRYRKFASQWDGSTLYATALPDGEDDGGKEKEKKNKEDGEKEGRQQFAGGERVITVIDSRQARLQRIISQVLARIGGTGGRQYHHLSYEAVTLSSDTARSLGIDIGERQFMHMSGRKGVYVNADYVLDTLHRKAYEEVKARNPEFSEEILHEIAEEIAISAIRYNLVRQDLDKIITFDVKESLSLEGDTGPYLQYAYARSQRILEKAGARIGGGQEVVKSVAGARFELLTHESEIGLIKEIAKMDIVVEDAARSLGVKALARYAYSLATAFNLFYERVPVLKEEDRDVLAARLALVRASGIALKNALGLLGVTALERM